MCECLQADGQDVVLGKNAEIAYPIVIKDNPVAHTLWYQGVAGVYVRGPGGWRLCGVQVLRVSLMVDWFLHL
jgi:hypothetical protein